MDKKYEKDILTMINNLDNEMIHILTLKRELQSRLLNIDCETDNLIDKFEITNNLKDKILNDELRKIIESNSNFSLLNLKKKLKTLGAIDYKTNHLRGLRGIKLKNN